MFSDRSQHGGGGDSMGRPHRTATEADREGWTRADRTEGFYRPDRKKSGSSRSSRKGKR
ncbi:hypothetical protein AB0G95_21725 [Streptomyces virginiae]|uniref:hypothetical protein n=1 Tax=Streptomyces virginiae TaxID=1961 RepID=UPI00344633B3